MKFKSIAIALALTVSTPAVADLTFPNLTYRTGAFAVSGIPYADGFADYMTLLNERDGGIGGEKVNYIECETQYKVEKGVECYENTKGQGSLVYQPMSTGITYALIPKATSDGIPILSMGYGRTSAANGKVFSHIFNYPANYWVGASVVVKHMLDENGGNIKGKKLALVHLDAAYGREPIPTLKALAKKHGFKLTTIPVAYGAEQKSQWLQIRREKHDYVTMWGWGVMNPSAIQEAANIRFPMDKFIGIWWSGSEGDVIPAGDAANGYKSLALHNTGSGFPIYADLKKHVYDKGLSSGAGDQSGTVLYNRGIYSAMLVTEAARQAQKKTGKANISPADMRDAMEAFTIDEARMTDLGLPNFAPSFSVSCENHGGNGIAAIQQWDSNSKKWNMVTDFIEADMDVINPLIAADSAAYAAENKIQERCG